MDRIVQLESENARLTQQLTLAQSRIDELCRQLFGAKADRLSCEQEDQLKEVMGDLLEQAQRSPSVQIQVLEEDPPPKAVRRQRHPLPEHLETIRVVLEPPPSTCPHCGLPKDHCIGQEESQEIEMVPARLIRKVTVRPKKTCRCGQSGVAIAPLPPRLVPQSRLGLGLAVYILLARFDDHLAYYTLEKIFRERFGVIIPRQQMVQWVEQIALLLVGIYNVMWQQMKEGGYLQIDETPVKVLDPEVKGKAAQGYLWFYAVPNEDVIVEFSSGRGQDVPKARLEGFRGRIQSDGYDVYPCVERDLPGIKRHGCLAHSRRKFHQAALEGLSEAIWFIGQIRKLYRIEDRAREENLNWEDRHRLRQEQNAPGLWEEIKNRAEETKSKLLPQSTLGKAINYFLHEYPALIKYLEDGRYEIDNNLVENAIRPACVGKKRWLFLGHPDAGWRSAVVYSLIISCRRRGINPQEYLTDVLSQLPAMKSGQEINLVPGRWKPRPPDSG